MSDSPKTPDATGTSRRGFLKRGAGAFGFSVMPAYLALGRADAAGNLPPSQRIQLACIGVGGRAAAVVPGLCRDQHAVPVAFCDVDFEAPGADANLRNHPGVKRFADFRRMFDAMEDDIDAVSVVTPDHTHFTATMDAMRRGKHVYVEKPLTHNFREAELLMRAADQFGVVTQMGNQGHTSAGSVQFEHLVERGIIRDIVRIEAWKTPSLWFMEADQRIHRFPSGESPPDSLDWDLWCGPKPVHDYSRRLHPFDWRGFYAYGNGMLGDWGAHIIDFAHDFLKLGLPTRIDPVRMEDHNAVTFPLASRLRMEFPERGPGMPACELVWHDGHGCVPEVDPKFHSGGGKPPRLGEAGTLLHRRDGEFLVQRGSHEQVSRLLPKETMLEYREDMKAERPEFNHLTGFIQACKGRGETRSPFRIGGELTQVLMLGVVCQRLNEALEFDPGSKRFKGNARANELLDGPPPRRGWEEFYRLG